MFLLLRLKIDNHLIFNSFYANIRILYLMRSNSSWYRSSSFALILLIILLIKEHIVNLFSSNSCKLYDAQLI